MSNVNHRYSSESWALDLSGKRSPLSRWTGRDVLSNETFRLSLLGAEGGVAPVVWLSGDRACFEDLYQTLGSYVQSGLREPVLAGQSTFPSVPVPEAWLNGDKAASSRHSNGGTERNDSADGDSPANRSSAEGSSSTGSGSIDAPRGSDTGLDRDRSQFSIRAQGLLRHTLSYSPADSSSPRQMQLSTLQLADLLAVLEQWQAETLALPTRQSRLRVLPGSQGSDFVVPTWGRIAASLLVALGATGSGAYLLFQNWSESGEQVALESASAPAEEGSVAASPGFGAGAAGNVGGAFGQFPTASGPPITSQAQDGDAAFNNPLISPPAGDVPPPPGLSLPTPPLPDDNDLPNNSNLGQIPLPPPLFDSASGAGTVSPASGGLAGSIDSDLPAGASTSSGDDRFIGGDLGLSGSIASGSSIEAPPFPAPTLEDSPLLANEAAPEAAEKTEAEIAEANIVASAPLLAPELSAELDTDPASSANTEASSADEAATASEATREAAITAAPSVFSSPSSDAPQSTTDGSSRDRLRPMGEAARIDAAPPPPAPPVPQVTVAKPLPGNNQSRAVQAYLQSQWKAPAAIQDPLQYRLSVSPEGKLASIEALSPTAQLYVNDAQLPAVGSPISGAADTVQSTMVVTLTPSGQVNVAVERATPVTP